MAMPMASFHEIDPDGDVDLVLQHPKKEVSHLDGVLESPPTPPRLNFRLSNTKNGAPEPEPGVYDEPAAEAEPYTYEESPAEEPEPEPESGTFDEPPAESEPYTYRESPAEPESEPVDEALEPDVYPETPTTPAPEALAIPEEPSYADPTGSVLAKGDATSTPDENCVRIRASSKHLTLASSYFKRNLGSGMLESYPLSSQGHVEFRMDENDPEAMLIVINIIHGYTRRIPRFIDLDMLTRLAVLVDYLKCHEVIEPFSDRWIDDLKGSITVTYSKVLIQWLYVSFVFRKACQFNTLARTAIRQTRGSMQTLGLPIRESVVDKINQQRSDTLDWLLSALEDLLDDYRQDRILCTFECNAMRYGALAKELGCRELLFPRPQAPFLGYSFENVVASVRKIQDPQWRNSRSKSGSFYASHKPHACQLTSDITPIISSIDDSLKRLSLWDELQPHDSLV